MRELIANLKHAARNRQHATIGGGDFGPGDLRCAAGILETHADLLAALQALLPHVPGYQSGDSAGRPWLDQALTAIAKATAARDASC